MKENQIISIKPTDGKEIIALTLKKLDNPDFYESWLCYSDEKLIEVNLKSAKGPTFVNTLVHAMIPDYKYHLYRYEHGFTDEEVAQAETNVGM
jgi:hypothetical protein